MKLYVYDHCPYCVKARMIFGLKEVPFEIVILLNDDEETPTKMIGQKMLPVLETEDGTYMPESLEIIAFVDQLKDYGPSIVGPSGESAALNQWLKDTRAYHYRLAMPRWPEMGLGEFATQSAVEYFTKKKEQTIGPFAENRQKSFELTVEANSHLQVLESIIKPGPYFWGENLSLDDFHVFASLRCLTTTKGVVFPSRIKNYMNEMSQKSQVPLHWDMAL